MSSPRSTWRAQRCRMKPIGADFGKLGAALRFIAGCRITEPGRGAGDERERIFHSVSVVKGEARRSPAL